MVYPRKLYIEFGNQDKLFDFTYGIESFENLTKMCKNVGMDWVSLTVFDGVHEFCMDDAPIEKLIADLKQMNT